MAQVLTAAQIKARIKPGEGLAPMSRFEANDKFEKMENEIERRVDLAVTKVVEQNLGRKLTAQEMRGRLDILLAKHDFNPMEELILTAKDPDTLPSEKIKICLNLVEYMLPKLKSVEVKGEVDHQHTIVIERYGEDGKAIREPFASAVRPTPADAKMIVDVVSEATMEDVAHKEDHRV
jgi:hypothetical protein